MIFKVSISYGVSVILTIGGFVMKMALFLGALAFASVSVPAVAMTDPQPFKLCWQGKCGQYAVINPFVEPDDEDGQINATVIIREGNKKDGFNVRIMCGGDNGAYVTDAGTGKVFEIPAKTKNIRFRTGKEYILFNVWRATCKGGVK
ncbi:hypothetical protein phiOC_p160 [Ochrobactrum phage vB_OspM_OC]|nr:hypothetical protein phiOC_p160 [Ochrobactrum phage vB_OspM_OC]